MTLSVTFERDGADLTVTDYPPAAGLWLPENGIQQVDRDLRRTYAPDSAYRGGKTLLAVVEEASAVPLTIYAKAASEAALQALRDELEAAATQWVYALTVTVDGVATTYTAEPSLPVWVGASDSGMSRVHLDRCQLVIPVNP
jgi:hypothetical protein